MIALAITSDEAQRLTQRIRLVAQTLSENIDKLKLLVAEARESNAYAALGYPSWTAYLADVLGETPLRLEREVRQELVAELSAQGMSTRAIAPIVGASQRTVAGDVSKIAHLADDGDLPAYDAETGEVIEAELVDPEPVRPVVGLDGKQYTATPQRQIAKPSTELSILNDVRLYLRNLATSPSIIRLSTVGKQHIINALQETITQLEGSTK